MGNDNLKKILDGQLNEDRDKTEDSFARAIKAKMNKTGQSIAEATKSVMQEATEMALQKAAEARAAGAKNIPSDQMIRELARRMGDGLDPDRKSSGRA